MKYRNVASGVLACEVGYILPNSVVDIPDDPKGFPKAYVFINAGKLKDAAITPEIKLKPHSSREFVTAEKTPEVVVERTSIVVPKEFRGHQQPPMNMPKMASVSAGESTPNAPTVSAHPKEVSAEGTFVIKSKENPMGGQEKTLTEVIEDKTGGMTEKVNKIMDKLAGDKKKE